MLVLVPALALVLVLAVGVIGRSSTRTTDQD